MYVVSRGLEVKINKELCLVNAKRLAANAALRLRAGPFTGPARP